MKTFWLNIDYTNYKGVRSWHTVEPIGFRLYPSPPPHHKKPGVYLVAHKIKDGTPHFRTYDIEAIHAMRQYDANLPLNGRGPVEDKGPSLYESVLNAIGVPVVDFAGTPESNMLRNLLAGRDAYDPSGDPDKDDCQCPFCELRRSAQAAAVHPSEERMTDDDETFSRGVIEGKKQHEFTINVLRDKNEELKRGRDELRAENIALEERLNNAQKVHNRLVYEHGQAIDGAASQLNKISSKAADFYMALRDIGNMRTEDATLLRKKAVEALNIEKPAHPRPWKPN